MPTPKVESTLRSRTDLTDAQIASLFEADAWKQVYDLDELEKSAKQKRNPQICFTGFSASERAHSKVAVAAGLEVKDSVTTTLKYLCAGPSAGPSKLEKAKTRGVAILSVKEFLSVCGQS